MPGNLPKDTGADPEAKEAIFAESRGALDAQERMVRLALNEAEAVAWQTKYPHLVFPALATEKVQAVAAWNNHQRTVWQTTHSLPWRRDGRSALFREPEQPISKNAIMKTTIEINGANSESEVLVPFP